MDGDVGNVSDSLIKEGKMKQTKRSIAIFMAPAVSLMLLIFLYPSLRTAFMSLFNVKNVTTPFSEWKFIGFGNFLQLFRTPLFVRSMFNIFNIWVWCGVATMLLSLLFALAFTKELRFKKFFRMIVYLPNVIATIAVGYMWLLYVYNSQFGLLTTVFSRLGLKALASYQWLASDHMFLSMCIANVFGNVGYFMMMYIAGIEKIPIDYFEAASLEGANSFQRFWYITLPLTKGVFRTAIILWTTRTMGFFALSQVFTGISTFTPMLFTYLTLFGTDVASDSVNAGMAAAAALLMTSVVVIVSSIFNCAIKDENYEI